MIVKQLAFIGAGNMARAIISGLLAKGYPKDAICATTRREETAAAAQAALGVQVLTDNPAVINKAEVVVLAVKPQMLAEVSRGIKAYLKPGQLLISVAAGIEINSLEAWLGANHAIIRAMPNTPSQVSAGATGLYANSQASADHRAFAEQLAAATGTFIWVDHEQLMHAVTAVSGSGPAYYFYIMEAMIAAGVAQGLSAEQSRALTLQTALGAATLAQTSEFEPGELKRRVMSPGGTTEQAIRVFESESLNAIIAQGMAACAKRSTTLAQELGQSISE